MFTVQVPEISTYISRNVSKILRDIKLTIFSDNSMGSSIQFKDKQTRSASGVHVCLKTTTSHKNMGIMSIKLQCLDLRFNVHSSGTRKFNLVSQRCVKKC
ncbi:hypothetical protein CEXT_160981 [Caerostris extrusa]|uniref:Uncharacterized protein n=1 Tax=Caerostris extrusa TaxID=172846 RepID=A0AAV4W9Z5_CAEEX|nr:hypothetical protein CEXT_160981 [Caerostris extrusa]